MQTHSSTHDTEPKSNACYHCGEDCGNVPITLEEKLFCCNGCKTVFEILSQSNACDYYKYEEHPGLKAGNSETGSRFAYLDNDEIRGELLEFSEEGVSKVKLLFRQSIAVHAYGCWRICSGSTRG